MWNLPTTKRAGERDGGTGLRGASRPRELLAPLGLCATSSGGILENRQNAPGSLRKVAMK
eukprot:13487838-Alexandrium_andersonii.AAC.1